MNKNNTIEILPMLAKEGKIKDIHGDEYLCQPKLNGIRAMWHPAFQVFLTKNGNIIHSVDHIIKQLKTNSLSHLPLDGEIFTSKISFQKINGLVRQQKTNTDSMILEFHVFDIADTNMACEERVLLLDDLSVSPHVKRVCTDYPRTRKQVDQFYKQYLKQGFEGIILRKKIEPYYPDRTPALLKIKPVKDMEGELIGFAPPKDKYSKNNNTFGSLILKLKTGVVFNCGGLTDKARRELWDSKPIGSSITFKYGAMSDKGKPIFPRYSHIRWDQTIH